MDPARRLYRRTGLVKRQVLHRARPGSPPAARCRAARPCRAQRRLRGNRTRRTTRFAEILSPVSIPKNAKKRMRAPAGLASAPLFVSMSGSERRIRYLGHEHYRPYFGEAGAAGASSPACPRELVDSLALPRGNACSRLPRRCTHRGGASSRQGLVIGSPRAHLVLARRREVARPERSRGHPQCRGAYRSRSGSRRHGQCCTTLRRLLEGRGRLGRDARAT